MEEHGYMGRKARTRPLGLELSPMNRSPRRAEETASEPAEYRTSGGRRYLSPRLHFVLAQPGERRQPRPLRLLRLVPPSETQSVQTSGEASADLGESHEFELKNASLAVCLNAGFCFFK